jgi:hypothetical protein
MKYPSWHLFSGRPWSRDTDLRKTFSRWRKQLAKEQQSHTVKVIPIKKESK